MGVGILFFPFSYSGLHPEARRRLKIAQTRGPSQRTALLASSPVRLPWLISRDRGRCRTGARRRSRSAGWGRRQRCACTLEMEWNIIFRTMSSFLYITWNYSFLLAENLYIYRSSRSFVLYDKHKICQGGWSLEPLQSASCFKWIIS